MKYGLKTLDDTSNVNDIYPFPEMELNSLLNSACLKMKFNEIYYPIQIIKNSFELESHETNPTISDSLYLEDYTCPIKPTKNVQPKVNLESGIKRFLDWTEANYIGE